jgi:hypothetical protein
VGRDKIDMTNLIEEYLEARRQLAEWTAIKADLEGKVLDGMEPGQAIDVTWQGRGVRVTRVDGVRTSWDLSAVAERLPARVVTQLSVSAIDKARFLAAMESGQIDREKVADLEKTSKVKPYVRVSAQDGATS